jgi:hypothetical protein
MALSNWNQYIDRLLAADLTVAEHRLALSFARALLGWNQTEGGVGRKKLRELANLDGRTFSRALDALAAKGIITILEPGGPGRGNAPSTASNSPQKRPPQSGQY